MDRRLPEDASREVRVEATGEVISALFCRIPVPGGAPFDLFVQAGADDDITRALLAGSYTLPAPYSLLPALAPPGGRVIDLGAHLGTFALFAAALGHPVAAVEASPRNAALLRESVRANGFSAVQVIGAAASDRAGRLEFIENGPYGLVATPALPSPTVQVPALAVDDLVADLGWDRVDFLKMDIEGSEVAAIRGMPRLLSRADAPALLFESNGHTLDLFAATPGELMASLEAFGYRCFYAGSGALVPASSREPQFECVVDCLAVKRLPAVIDPWKIVAPLSRDETIELALRAAADPNPHIRAHVARALAEADAAIRNDLRIVRACGGRHEKDGS